MKIYEYQAKNIFSNSGISIPQGTLINKSENFEEILGKLNFSKYILKAQVYTGGRGKAGLVVKTDDTETALIEAKRLFKTANKILIEEQINIDKELYAGFIVDRSKALHKLIFSCSGGMEIEELSLRSPAKITTKEIDIFTGLLPYQLREILGDIDFDIKIKNSIYKTLQKLYEIFIGYEATLCEINPLAVTDSGDVVAVDAKIVFDDDGLFRHKDILGLRIAEDEEPLEREAKNKKLSYVKLDGNIGCMVNGAGLAMATMDVMKHFSGSPANFLDIGGAAKAEQVEDSLYIINRDKNVRAIFVNIFGGIVRCDEVADGIVRAKNKFHIDKPIVIRLIGTNDTLAYEILKRAGLSCYKKMSEAAKAVVSLSAAERKMEKLKTDS